ncbi:MAG: ribosomal pseudouridine synthase large subunit, partial [Bacteroidota bacterium]
MSVVINIPDHILFEDEVVLVINKPAGLMVEPDRNGHANLLQQVKKYLKNSSTSPDEVYAQHIHRLDRPVSGVILFTKQRAALKNLSEQFAERKVKKYYQALTEHAPAKLQDTLEHWHRKEKKKAALYETEIEYSEKAALIYEVIRIAPNRYLWNIELHTGKYHQIRAQLSYIGCPILGDQLYGSMVNYQPDAIALHASRLTFFHPISGKEITIKP